MNGTDVVGVDPTKDLGTNLKSNLSWRDNVNIINNACIKKGISKEVQIRFC